MRSRVASPVLVLAVLAALLVGSIGSATASGLTTKSVKKIAAKVIKKSAPGLSVSHATTADTATNAANSTTLQGQPASQYKNPAYRFVLPVQASAATRSYSFPGVPAGSYLATYNVFVTVATGGATIACQIRASAGSPWETFSGSMAYGSNNPTSVGAGVLQLTGAPPELFCSNSGSTFTIYSGSTYLSTVTFTRVDGITNGTVTSARTDRDTALAPDAR